MIHLYGIPNCDSVSKARKWFSEQNVSYVFHDYKKEGVDAAMLNACCDVLGWEILLNKRGTTWRKLPDSDKQDVQNAKAVALMMAHPSMIKRPIVISENIIEVGFSEPRYQELFA